MPIGYWTSCQWCQLGCLKVNWPPRNEHNNTKQPFYGPLSGTTRVSRYQKKHSPTHHPEHHSIFISFFHLPRSMASSLFKLHAWQEMKKWKIIDHKKELIPYTSLWALHCSKSIATRTPKICCIDATVSYTNNDVMFILSLIWCFSQRRTLFS